MKIDDGQINLSIKIILFGQQNGRKVIICYRIIKWRAIIC